MGLFESANQIAVQYGARNIEWLEPFDLTPVSYDEPENASDGRHLPKTTTVYVAFEVEGGRQADFHVFVKPRGSGSNAPGGWFRYKHVYIEDGVVEDPTVFCFDDFGAFERIYVTEGDEGDGGDNSTVYVGYALDSE